MTAGDPLAVAALIAAALERLGIRYVIGGSLASVAFGEPRGTLDVDVAADIGPEGVAPFLAALAGSFLVDQAWAAEEVRRHGSFQAIHAATMIRVDVFVPAWTGFHLWKWEQRRRVVLSPSGEVALDVTSPEAIVLQKLVWYRDGGRVSDRQWRDVLGVLKTQSRGLAFADLRRWADQLGVTDLLERALGEAGLG